MTVEVGRACDEIRHIERQEPVAIEASRMALRQHKGLVDPAPLVDVAEIGARIETIVTAGAEDQPAGVGAPVVERLCIFGVRLFHGAAFSGSEIQQVEVCLMMPDAELSVVSKRIADKTSVVGRTREAD